MSTPARLRALSGALLPSLLFALSAHTPASAEDTVPPAEDTTGSAEDTTDSEEDKKARDAEAYALVVTEKSAFITVNELERLCYDRIDWPVYADTTALPTGSFCGVDEADWDSITDEQKAEYHKDRAALFARIDNTCSLRTIVPNALMNRAEIERRQADAQKKAEMEAKKKKAEEAKKNVTPSTETKPATEDPAKADPPTSPWELPLATFDELKSVADGSCPVTIKDNKQRKVRHGASARPRGQSSESSVTTNRSTFTSDLLWATTGVVVDRALETVELWGLNRTLLKMCNAAEVDEELSMARLVPNTCALATAGLSSDDIASFGARLKAAATNDAITLPRHLATELLFLEWYEGGAAETPGVTHDMVLSTALLASMMELMVNGHHPIDALGAWARSGKNPNEFKPDWQIQPFTTGLYLASFLIANLETGDLSFTDEGLLELRNHLKSGAGEPSETYANELSDLSITMLYNSTQSLLPAGWLKNSGDGIVPKEAETEAEAKTNAKKLKLEELILLQRVADRLFDAGHAVQAAWLTLRSAETGVPVLNRAEMGPTQEQAWRSLATATSGLLEAVVGALDVVYSDKLDESKPDANKKKEAVGSTLTKLSAMLGAVGASDRTGATLKGIELALDLLNTAATRLVEGLEKIEPMHETLKDLQTELDTLEKQISSREKALESTAITQKQRDTIIADLAKLNPTKDTKCKDFKKNADDLTQLLKPYRVNIDQTDNNDTAPSDAQFQFEHSLCKLPPPEDSKAPPPTNAADAAPPPTNAADAAEIIIQKLKSRLNILRTVMQEAGDGATLVGGLYGAQSSEDMEAVLSAYVSPPGSYEEKRNQPGQGYMTLNAYVGGGFGAEFMRGAAESDTVLSDPSEALWPVVAIGPEFGGRICDECNNPTNLGVFVPLIDLGTLAQYRFEHSETTAFPTVDLRSVFAPGAYATLGLSGLGSPFALQAGASWAPALREISEDGKKETRSAVRAGVNVVVDVPLRN